MVLFRFIIVIALAALGVSLALFIFTRDRRYLGYAGQIFKIGLIVVLVIGALFALERII
ncbi:MAG: hypothetical protein ABIP64_04185 [Burkholderiales bacterium]